jgi:hypothetical protein
MDSARWKQAVSRWTDLKPTQARNDRLGGTFQRAPMLRRLVEGAEARYGYSSSMCV